MVGEQCDGAGRVRSVQLRQDERDEGTEDAEDTGRRGVQGRGKEVMKNGVHIFYRSCCLGMCSKHREWQDVGVWGVCGVLVCGMLLQPS